MNTMEAVNLFDQTKKGFRIDTTIIHTGTKDILYFEDGRYIKHKDVFELYSETDELMCQSKSVKIYQSRGHKDGRIMFTWEGNVFILDMETGVEALDPRIWDVVFGDNKDTLFATEPDRSGIRKYTKNGSKWSIEKELELTKYIAGRAMITEFIYDGA